MSPIRLALSWLCVLFALSRHAVAEFLTWISRLVINRAPKYDRSGSRVRSWGIQHSRITWPHFQLKAEMDNWLLVGHGHCHIVELCSYPLVCNKTETTPFSAKGWNTETRESWMVMDDCGCIHSSKHVAGWCCWQGTAGQLMSATRDKWWYLLHSC